MGAKIGVMSVMVPETIGTNTAPVTPRRCHQEGSGVCTPCIWPSSIRCAHMTSDVAHMYCRKPNHGESGKQNRANVRKRLRGSSPDANCGSSVTVSPSYSVGTCMQPMQASIHQCKTLISIAKDQGAHRGKLAWERQGCTNAMDNTRLLSIRCRKELV